MRNAMHSPSPAIITALALALGGCFEPSSGDDGDTGTEGTGGTMGSPTSNPSGVDDGGPGDDGGPTGPDDGDDDDPTDPSDGTATTGVDDTTGTDDADTNAGEPPTVIDVSPASGATAVLADTNIVLTFSEAMDQSSVENAFDAGALGDVTFSWNGNGTVVTIDPPTDLAYAQGTTPLGLDALEYAFSVSTSATDVGGTAMEAMFQSSFFTAREITTSIEHDPGYTGAVLSNGTLVTGSGDDPVPGDTNTNVARRGFMGFAITSLPQGIIAFQHAEVRAVQWLVSGDPIPALGASLSILHIPAEALPGGAYASTALQDLGVWTNEDSYAADNIKMAVVTDNVEYDYEGGESHTQFRLQFPTATNFNSAFDTCRYNNEVLEVRYLIE